MKGDFFNSGLNIQLVKVKWRGKNTELGLKQLGFWSQGSHEVIVTKA